MLFDILSGALAFMQNTPRPLAKSIAASASLHSEPNSVDITAVFEYLKEASPGNEVVGKFRSTLAGWDNESGATWIAGTPQNSTYRRELIYKLLELDSEFVELCEDRFPFHPLEQPVVIASEHTQWYTSEVRQARSFYWDAYKLQLAAQKWPEESIRQLDESTTSVVERLSDPSRPEAYQSKGLVVGYVQSGKTANFTGVIAKAGDAGYKLIIVLAGLHDVLRAQTQRRIDKDMIGRELLDTDYALDADLEKFVSHGAKPSALGSFDWYRLTGPESDYQKLGRGLDALKFEAADATKPFWHKDNLFSVGARIVIVKKNSKVIEKFLQDLRLVVRTRLGVSLNQVPALIIDDESDQASANTKKNKDERTATNKAIVELLQILRRAQYVGYTATPFANVFIDPNNEADIFPKDFLISLPRPDGYMGVSDFYDLEGSPTVPGSEPNKLDYVRSVVGANDKPKNLQKALDSFILSGAIKLYRQSLGKGLGFRHHTMLVHSSSSVADHAHLALEVRNVYRDAGYHGDGLDRLKDLYETDFYPVSQRRGQDHLLPKKFEELSEFIGECISLVGLPNKAVLQVNGENNDDTPNFDRIAVWKILVGGNKLSRGYTIEGLTTSYYRRTAKAADTLMQMGRWFGFRQGYRDLVRLFIGTEEPLSARSRKKINLYDAFGAVCRDEEMFRGELKKYAQMTEPRVLPSQIPPLVPSHMLKPTSPNKMYNARITYRNYASSLSESTYAPGEVDGIQYNNNLLAKLLKGVTIDEVQLTARVNGRNSNLNANVAVLEPASVLSFIEHYRWFDSDDPQRKSGSPMSNQIEYLKGSGPLDPEIDDWVFFAPSIGTPRAYAAVNEKGFPVVFRGRSPQENRFNTYNDPIHRQYAEHMSMTKELKDPNAALDGLRRKKRAVLMYYPITDLPEDKKARPPFSVGFTLLFPASNIRVPVRFSVIRDDKDKDAVVIQL